MIATSQIFPKQSGFAQRGRRCENESLPDFVQEHFASLAYANKVGWLYVAVSMHPDGYEVCKIGFSMNPEKRVQDLNGATPFRKSRLVAAVKARMVDEMALHQLMAAHQLNSVHREWYLPSPKVDALSTHLLEYNSLPHEIVSLGDALAVELIGKRLKRYARAEAGRFLRSSTKAERENARENILANPQNSAIVR